MYYNTLYDSLSIIAFIFIFCIFPDMDYLTLTKKYHITNTVFGLILLSMAMFGIYMLRVNKTISVLIFILFFMIMKTRFNYVELFTNQNETVFSVDSHEPDPTATQPVLIAQELEVAKDFLIKQTDSDPNKTKLEKSVINEIINHYFVKSDKLKQLQNFNVSAQVANPIPGDQKLA